MTENKYWNTRDLLCTEMKPKNQVSPNNGARITTVLKAALKNNND